MRHGRLRSFSTCRQKTVTEWPAGFSTANRLQPQYVSSLKCQPVLRVRGKGGHHVRAACEADREIGVGRSAAVQNCSRISGVMNAWSAVVSTMRPSVPIASSAALALAAGLSVGASHVQLPESIRAPSRGSAASVVAFGSNQHPAVDARAPLDGCNHAFDDRNAGDRHQDFARDAGGARERVCRRGRRALRRARPR